MHKNVQSFSLYVMFVCQPCNVYYFYHYIILFLNTHFCLLLHFTRPQYNRNSVMCKKEVSEQNWKKKMTIKVSSYLKIGTIYIPGTCCNSTHLYHRSGNLDIESSIISSSVFVIKSCMLQSLFCSPPIPC